jgi:hypothetical protein
MSVRSTEACWVVWIGAPDEMRIQITVPMSDTHTEGRVNPRMHVTRTQPVTCVQRCSAGMLATELTTACGGPLLGGRQPSCNYTWVCSDSTTGGRRGVLDRSLPVRTCTPTKLTVVNVGDAYMHSTGRRTCTAIM